MRSSSAFRLPFGLALGALALLAGCTEFVHMGQVSDRESSFSVNGVRIEQQQPDGSWKEIGTTDGRGRWWILRDRITPGRRVRLVKAGYHPLMLTDTEFVQENSLIMMPDGSTE